MGLLDNYFANSTKIKKILHILQFVLSLGAFITGIALLADNSMRKSRSMMMPFIYSIKSLVIVTYIYLAEHTQKFSRFRSLKAYTILSILETLFWFTGFILMCMGGKACRSSSCALVGVLATLAFLLCFAYLAIVPIAWRDWRHSKKAAAASHV